MVDLGNLFLQAIYHTTPVLVRLRQEDSKILSWKSIRVHGEKRDEEGKKRRGGGSYKEVGRDFLYGKL